MPVKLYGRSHPAHNAARMVYHTGHRPCGCQGIKELKGPSRGHGLKGLNVKGSEKSPNPRASGSQGIEGSPCWPGLPRSLASPKSMGFRDKWVQGSFTRPWFQRSQCQRFLKVSKS